jgi:rRNA maturation protein Nop10
VGGDGTSLSEDEARLALASIAAWRTDPEAEIACPRCRALGLQVADFSARPHAEWYTLECPACGLDTTLNIPLGHSLA